MSSAASSLTAELAQILHQPFSLAEREPVPGFTIDSDTSRDLDDAIWLEPTAKGATISVHIADVTAVIPPNSQLERQALAKVETRYLARGNHPMFPRQLAEDKLSLLENQLRPTVTVRVTVDESANLQDVQLRSTYLTSLKQFSYGGADSTLGQPESPFFQLLRYCQLWAEKLAWKRRSLGAIGQTTIGGVSLDEEGRLTALNRYHSQQIIQEFMVLANTAVAQLAEQHQLPLLYRNQTASAIAPAQRELIETLMSLGVPELMRQKLQSWLKPASYSPAALGHFALALPAYTHFTSPIRRFADCVNHRLLKAAFLEEQPSPYTREQLQAIGEQINQYRQEVLSKKEEYFRSQRQKQAVQTIRDSGKLSALSRRDFSQVLKDTCRLGKLDQLLPEALARLEQGQLNPRDLYYLVWGQEAEIQNRELLQQTLLDYLEQKPALATQIIQIAGQMSNNPLEYREQATESGKFAFWTLLEGQASSSPAMASNKQAAKHLSNRQWLADKLAGTLIEAAQLAEYQVLAAEMAATAEETAEAEEPEPLDLSPLPPAAIESPVPYLHDCLQQRKKKQPTYQYSPTGSGWKCLCQVTWSDEISVAKEGVGNNKKEAKNQATLAAIAALNWELFSELK